MTTDLDEMFSFSYLSSVLVQPCWWYSDCLQYRVEEVHQTSFSLPLIVYICQSLHHIYQIPNSMDPKTVISTLTVSCKDSSVVYNSWKLPISFQYGWNDPSKNARRALIFRQQISYFFSATNLKKNLLVVSIKRTGLRSFKCNCSTLERFS